MTISRELTAPEVVAAWDGLVEQQDVSPLAEQKLEFDRFRRSSEYLDLGWRFLAVRAAVVGDDDLFNDLAAIFSTISSSLTATTLYRDGAGTRKQILFTSELACVAADVKETGFEFVQTPNLDADSRAREFFAGLVTTDRAFIETAGIDGTRAGLAWSGGNIRVLIDGEWCDDDSAAAAATVAGLCGEVGIREPG
ncbi:hypothetical protein [Microbacterium sp. 22242]|uniref:hypothetical protein n=1 Tax=Microbacterium sp. 22242 TaxID=3453896 RepID=UPI003F830320